MLYLEVKATGTVQNFPPIISSSFVAEFAVLLLWHSVFCMYLHRAAFSGTYAKRLALLELAAFLLLLSLSIRRTLQVYVGIQAALCTGC